MFSIIKVYVYFVYFSREEMNDVMDDSDDEDSNLISWGCGEFGQHGHGIQEDIPIDDGLIDNFINNSQVKMVACGASHVIVVTSKYHMINVSSDILMM